MAVNITITDAGRAEVINASNTGTQAVTITTIELGTGQYTPSADQTALQHPFKPLDTVAGQVVSPDIIHVTLRDDSDDAYTVSEFGLFTDKGTLFAVYSLPDQSLMEKSAASTLLLSVDIELGTLDTANITFGDASFANPPASETVPGVAELATQEETNSGTDDLRIVTPKKLKAAVSRFVPQASESTAGKARIATQEETDTGSNDQLIVTPKKLKSSLATQVPAASTTTAGKVELATVTEAKKGIDSTKSVTPEGMKAAIEQFSQNLPEEKKYMIVADNYSRIGDENGWTLLTDENFPDKVASSTRYEVKNPFGDNVPVYATPQIFWDGTWGNPEWIFAYSAGGRGIRTNYLGDGITGPIIVQTGRASVNDRNSNNMGDPFNSIEGAGGVFEQSLPCRVLITRMR